jgi:uncharacterized protein YdiU (UPF0061 family)
LPAQVKSEVHLDLGPAKLQIRSVPSSLSELSFDNSFVRNLPADAIVENFRRQVRDAAYSRVRPTPVSAPHLLAYSREVAELLALPAALCESPEFAEVFAGNRVLPGMDPYAACYGGHQFGNWAGQLGDGRAITLGEVLGAGGRRWELQLKGAGLTPYSRTADGRAVLRSSLREFLCSEAMHHLGVPTTRALCLVATGDKVVRDMFYDGRPAAESGAVVCRVAPSFVRFGNFEITAARKQPELAARLADWVIETHLPELAAISGKERYQRWFEWVCHRTRELVVHWMRVGFVHGVMNTDNMSILGLTIDYGPYGWLEDYDLDWTPNTTDAAGRRYRYGHQPAVALWNLSCLASAILPLVEGPAPLEAALERCAGALEADLLRMMQDKLGLYAGSSVCAELASELPRWSSQAQLDMTLFFRRLSSLPAGAPQSWLEHVLPTSYFTELAEPGASAPPQPLAAAVDGLRGWLARYADAVREEAAPPDARKARMDAVNPAYVLRNYMAQLAIDRAEAGDPSLTNELLELLRHPYDDQPGHEQWQAKRPEWARNRPGCSMLSCSS